MRGRLAKNIEKGHQWGPCTRCNYTWDSYRSKSPRPKGWKPPNCPNCHSAYWDKPRVNQTRQMRERAAIRERAMGALPPPPIARMV